MTDADSVYALAPEGYDHRATEARLKALRQRLTGTSASYEVRASPSELYQDSTGLTHYRITAKGDLRPFAPTFAWIKLSHFGDLATVSECNDPELLTKIRALLEDFGLKYIPYDYVTGKTYNGKCRALRGFSWANRYFELIVEFNDEARPDSLGPPA